MASELETLTCTIIHLSVDDGRVLAAFGGGGVRVAGLGGRGFDGDELQGAGGALIRICGTKGGGSLA